MSDYYESEVEPLIGSDNFTANDTYKLRRKGEVKIYYCCENCNKKSKMQKICCNSEMTKCYDL